jgi:dTDP-4-dehydrorhamnose 3,5-epimerase-like enzyme
LTPSMASISDVRLLQFDTFAESRGWLTALEATADVPFEIRRLFYIYQVPMGIDRAGHAHPHTEQCIIAVAGSLDVEVTDGEVRRTFNLSNAAIGLYIPPMIWVQLRNFTRDTVCLSAASTHYVPEDVIRNWDDYLTRLSAAQSER